MASVTSRGNSAGRGSATPPATVVRRARSREFRDNREVRETRDPPSTEEGQGGNGWSGHQPDFLRRAAGNAPGNAPAGNGRFRRDGRPRTERKAEGAEEEQPSSSDSEPTNENSEDFASS